MRHLLTNEKVIAMLSSIVGDIKSQDESVITFTSKRFETEYDVVLNTGDLICAIDTINQASEENDTGIYNSYSYEILCKGQNRFSPFIRNIGKIGPLVDIDSGVTYELGMPSLAYTIKILDKAIVSGSFSIIRHVYLGTSTIMRIAEDNKISMDMYIYHAIFRCLSLKITSSKSTKLIDYHNLVTSYIFQISYNSSNVIIPIKTLDELFSRRIHGRMRRVDISQLDPPRRTYPNDIVYHYQMALSSDIPFLNYISFYHVFEHFFESVFNDDLIESVKKVLTSPSFSYKRTKDIAGIIRKVKNTVLLRGENQSFNEQVALKLTLEKHVDIKSLKDDLDNYSSKGSVYYRTNKVDFSDGNTIDFGEVDEEKILTQISKRVYKTRNSLVHSKDGDKSKYTPFHDDQQLLPELLLLQLMAEQVIISSSEIIK